MELFPHQQQKLDRNPAKSLIPFGTGVGKTITALELAHKNAVICLIICPKAQKKMWLREIAKYPEQHIVVTKEEFKVGYLTLGRFEGVIVDEAHHFTGKSGHNKVLSSYLKRYRPKYRWLLTATPYRSSPWNIQRLATFLDRPMPYKDFVHRFFHEIDMGGNPNRPGYKKKVVLFIKDGIENDIARWVQALSDGDVWAMSDVVDVPTQSIKTIYVEMTEEQKKGIEELEDTVFISRFTHMHCIENGILSGDGYVVDKLFENEKIREIYKILKNSGHDRFAIFCRYNAQIEYYRVEIESFGFSVFVINGSVSDRDALVLQIEAHKGRCVILIQSQCSEGYELPSISDIIFASLSWSYLDYVQAQGGESGGGRFLRINKLKENRYWHLVVKGGVDEDIYNCILKKQDFDIAIYQKQKERAMKPSLPF